MEDDYGEGAGGSLLELLGESEERVVALESRVEELEAFVDNMVEEVQARFEAIKAKL